MRRDSGSSVPTDQLLCPVGSLRPHSPSPLARPVGPASTPCPPFNPGLHLRSASDSLGPQIFADGQLDAFPPSPRMPRAFSQAATPPITPPSKRRPQLKAPRTPPAPSRKLLHLLPNITLTRSRSHESQLGNRIEEPVANRQVAWKSAVSELRAGPISTGVTVRFPPPTLCQHGYLQNLHCQ